MRRRPPRTGRWDDRYEAVACVTAAARLDTATKAFCNCAVAADAEPNVHTCPVCLGMPGALPVLNAGAVERGARAALALGGSVQLVSGFVRAHHAPHPAQPKGYVLTQRGRPLATRGTVQIGDTAEGAPITAAVQAAFLTEDVGRAVHGRFANATGMDYNLAGAPLLLVEGAPDLRAPAEVRAYVASVAALLRSARASMADLTNGTLTVVASVALRRRGALRPTPACELQGFRSLDDVERAIDAECARQAAVLDAGNPVEPTRYLWNVRSASAEPARAPADAPWTLVDPDLPPLLLTRDWVDERRAELPELPPDRRARIRRAYALDPVALDALTADADMSAYYETVARLYGNGPGAAQWIVAHALPVLARDQWTARDLAVRVRPADLARLLELRRAGTVSDDDSVRLFDTMARTGESVSRAAERENIPLVDQREPDGARSG